jgi:predicted DNA-binding transcriptional regulator AlpA
VTFPACPPILLDARNAATALGVGRSLFYQLCASGRIGPLPVKLGERSLWARAELEDWAAAGCPTREEWLRQKPSP